MLSFWERESFTEYDIIIVGAGITGLSAAASLKEQKPQLRILVVERGTIPTGASTRNAGFACFGSVSELAIDRTTLGDDGMVNLVSKRWQGLQKTITRLGAESIDLQQKGGYELLNTDQESFLSHISPINDLLKPVFGQQVFIQQDEKIARFGLQNTQHMIFNPLEGQLHTGKLMSRLWQYCAALGVQIITGTEVTGYEASAHQIDLTTPTQNFRAECAAFCTNAFTNSLSHHKLDIRPGRGMVMLIQPKSPVKLSGTYHYDEGYFYFRDFEDKIIFGGGRNLALQEEATTTFGINEKIKSRLVNDLEQIIIPDTDYQIDMIWSGIMAFGPNKSPVIEKSEEGVYIGARLGGMGVALGSLVGEELAQMMISDRF